MPRPKGVPASEAQKAAGRANLAKGRAAKEKQREAGRKAGSKPVADRWAMLLSGQLTVKDLDDAEIMKMRVRSKSGTFDGPARALPSHLAQQFAAEAVRRAKSQIHAATTEVTKELLNIARDEDVPVAQRIKVLMYLQDRQLGKAPETVRIEGASAFDEVTMEALGLDRGVDDGATADQ